MGVNPQNFTIAIVHEDGSYGTSCADGDQARASYYHLNVVDREPYSSASSDLSALVTKLKQVNPDVILITSYAADAQLFIRQSHELGLAPKVIIGHSGGWELPSTASALGPNIVGIFAVGTPVYAMNLTGLDPQVRSDFTQFTQQYQNRFNAIPAGWGIKSFTSTYHVLYKSVLPTAITKYGGVDPESIRKAFLDVNIPVGGTVVGYGVKFAAPETNDPGDNILATSHPVAEWFNSTQQGLVVVYPRNLALKQPDVTLYKPKGSSSVSSVQPITGTVYAPSGSREFQIVSLNPVPPLVSRYAAWDATSPS
jgi:branched-chain amino acid transport system substrate-binding protein